METLLPVLLGLIIGAALGTALGWFMRTARSPESNTAAELASANATVHALNAQLASNEDRFREQLRYSQQSHQQQLAHQVEQSAQLSDRLRDIQRAEAERTESDNRVLVALSPVQERLGQVQKKVSELEEQRQQQYGELSAQLRSAAESEERLRSTAESLASALSSNSTRGVWGETQLRRVVEAAGLIERVDFSLQHSVTSESGAGRPDLVVHLPGNKNIAVDAKVPLDSYLAASAISIHATGTEGAERTRLLNKHVKAVRDHITALSRKAYWSGLGASPELVIAFIPSESLISSALEADPALLDFAFSKKVALASPVTLWSVLKTVAFSWQQDVLTADAKQLFDLSRDLYSRLSTTAGHIEKLGRSLDRGVKDYNAFLGSFERNVYPAARKLSVLDESKVIGTPPVIEENARSISSFELLAELERSELVLPAHEQPERAQHEQHDHHEQHSEEHR